MIVLDTNVLSELMRPTASPQVRAWLNAQAPSTLYVTAITVAELRYGLDVLPAGRRRADLLARAEASLALFGDRLLPFTPTAGVHYGRLMARTRAAGLAVAMPDGLIAAIAAEHGFAVATRDVSPFAAAGLRVIDPWSATAG